MKKVINIFILFLFFGSFLLVFIPSTSATTYTENFDDEGVGGQVNEIWLDTFNIHDVAEVSNTEADSGANSYAMGTAPTSKGSAEWRYSYSGANYISNWSINSYLATANGDNRQIYINFTNPENETLIRLRFSSQFNPSQWTNLHFWDGDSWTAVKTSEGVGTWRNFGWEIIDEDTISYFYDGHVVLGIGATTDVLTSSVNRITTAWLLDEGGNEDNYYFDDHVIDVTESATSEYVQVGYGSDLSTDYTSGTGGWRRIIEWEYYGRLNTTIREFEVVMMGFNSLYLTYSGVTTDDVTLYINGFNAGHPTTVIPSGWAYNHDIVRWEGLEIPVTLDDINNGHVVFELKSDFSPHLLSSSFVTNWWVGGGPVITRTDMYGDGDIKTYHHGHTVIDGLLDKLNGMSYDVITAFWIDPDFDITWDEPKGSEGDYPDELSTDKDDYIARVETVHIYGHVDHLRSTNTLHIYRNAVEITDLTFPRLILSYEINEFFTPEQAGSYEVRLYRAGVKVANVFFNATTPEDEQANFSIWTDPNPSSIGTSYEIKYVYNHAENRIGKIVITQSDNFYDALNFGAYRYNQWFIEQNNLNGSVVDVRGLSGCYYIIMGVSLSNQTNGSFSSVAYTKHYVESNRETKIVSTRDKYPLSADEDGNILSVIIDLEFDHNLIGQNVHILINGKRITDYSLGCMPEGFYIYSTRTAGQYMVQLVVVNGSGYTEFAFYNFTVYEPDDLPEASFIPPVPVWLGTILGTVIVTCFLMLPVYVGSKYHRNIPFPVYGMCGGIGIVLSIKLTFFPPWVAFFLIAIGIIVAIIFFVQKRSAGGE